MKRVKPIQVGIGFATGRKSFQKVLKTYIYSFRESGLVDSEIVHLNLFVAYDLKYSNTHATDYTRVRNGVRDMVDHAFFIGRREIDEMIDDLVKRHVMTLSEARMVFDKGYAAMRNIIVYKAMLEKMDYLLFLDDDEYPLAVTNNTRSTAIWSGQHVLLTHLKYNQQADITNGHHCGYISPIPSLTFNETMGETTFRTFIEAISNDIVTWEAVRQVMDNGGVTYADTSVLAGELPVEVVETAHTKFITGANLCLNLTQPQRVFAFYNPPDARGEDTFLSTCLSNRKVVRIPSYAFHDGFSTYNHLLDGVLPIRLQRINADSDKIISRFYKACIGWIRYKPLLLYITQRESYPEKIREMRSKLAVALPAVCTYFGNPDFMNIQKELNKYDRNVELHYLTFRKTQEVWGRLMQEMEGRTPPVIPETELSLKL